MTMRDGGRAFAWWEIALLWAAAGAISHGWIPLMALGFWGLTRAGDWVCSRLECPARAEVRRRSAIRRQRRERSEAEAVSRKN